MEGKISSKLLSAILACMIIALMFIVFPSATIAASKFNIGDTVEVTTNLNVRTSPGTSYPEISDPDYPGYAPAGTRGEILSGPSTADGYVWWKVDFGPGLYSGWSVEGGLVKVVQRPSPPTPISPGSSSSPGQEIGTLTPTLQWSGVSNADYYALAISRYPYGSSYIVYNPQTVYGTSHPIPSGILESGQKYRWNMQAHNSAGWSDVSSMLYFQTTGADVTLTLYVHKDSTSGPVIPGAQVTGQDDDNSFNKTTNSSGYVTITGTPGTWSFTASKSGYETNSWSQSITATGTKHAYLTRGDVTLTLYVHEGSASGPVLSGVRVTGQDSGGSSFDKTTYSSGYVTITGTPGTWSFTASKSGYETNSWSQSITATGTKHAYLTRGDVTLTLYVHEGSASGPVLSGVRVTGQDSGGSSFDKTTYSSGYVTITGTPGTWSFTASKSGYETNSWSQSITATGTKHAYLTRGDVTLTLYVHEGSASGPVLSGVRVTGQDSGGSSFDKTTYSSGYVTITGTPGTWSFTASKSGYETNSWSQSITATGTKHAYLIEVVQRPSPPTPISPGSSSSPGQEIGTLTPTLQWSGVSNADYYALAISRYPYGSSYIVYNPQTVYGTSHPIPSGILESGQKYRWNMQAHNSAGWSDVSSMLYFQTTGADVTLTLYVHKDSTSGPVIPGAQVTGQDDDNSFNKTTNSSGYVTITGTPGTWSFTASKSGYETNSWSQSITATGTKHAYLIEVVQRPSPPTPISPGSSSSPGQEIGTLTPTLQWSGVSNADYYALAISRYPYGSSYIVYNPQTVYGTSHPIPSGILESGQKYRWNMQAHNSAGWSDVSSMLYFQTTGADVTLTLYVHKDSTSGPVIPGAQVTGQDDDNSFNKTTNSSGYVTITGTPGTWSFTASKSGYETNSWSQSITATSTKHAYLIEVVQRPSPPTPISPGSSSSPGQEIGTLTPTLQWSGVSNADYYALAISRYPYGSSYIVYNPQTVYGTSHPIPSGILESGQKYRWNMQAHNSAGWSDVSSMLYFQTTGVQKPDLIIEGITWSPSSPSIGDTVTFTVTIKNQGSGKASSSKVYYFIDGTQKTYDSVYSINPGTTTTETFTWKAEAGSHAIKAVADYNDEVAENDETNNEKTVTFSPDLCDLIIENITWSPSSPSIGDTVTFTVTIKNQGAGRANSSNVYYFIDDVQYSSDYVSSINPSATTTETFTWKAKAGSHAIKAVADYKEQVAENDETNNEKTVTFSPDLCDLIIENITWSPSSPSIGDTVTFTVTIKNQGAGRANSSNVYYFIDDVQYSSDYVSSINPSATTTETFTWKAKAGSHAIKAVVDYKEQVAEGDETNNEKTVAFSAANVTLTLYVHEDNASGTVIPEAQVTGQDGGGNSFDQTTNTSGYVTIAGAPGTWSFTASKSAYETKSWSQNITETCTKHAYLVKLVQKPSVPTPTSPGSDSSPGPVIDTSTPILIWEAADRTESYHVAISKAPYGISNIIYSKSGITDISHTVPSGYLEAGGEYSWNIRGDNAVGSSDFSNTLYFQIAISTCSMPGKDIPRKAPDFFEGVLNRRNIPVSKFASTALEIWTSRYEDTEACWNPLATTWDMGEKSWDFNDNVPPVQSYIDKETGIEATAKTLSSSYYEAIRDMLAMQSFDKQAIRWAVATWTYGPNHSDEEENSKYVVNLANEWQNLYLQTRVGEVTLTVSVSPSGGGSVSLDPSGGTYNEGTQVTLAASPASGYTFDHWEGNASGTSSSITIDMDSDKGVTAYFMQAPPFVGVSPAVLPFEAVESGGNPPSKTLSIWNAGGGSLDWMMSCDVAWLTLSKASGTSTGETDKVAVSVDITGIDAGDYNGTITIRGTGATSTSRVVPVSLSIRPKPIAPPDLTVPLVEAPSEGIAGQSISVTFVVENKGDDASGPFHNFVALSLKSKPWGTNVFLADVITDSILPDDSKRVTVDVTIPPSASSPSDYHVTVYADAFEKVRESNESNNIGSTYPETIAVTSKTPTIADLITSIATGGVPVTVDGEIYFILTLENRIDPLTLEVVPNSSATKVYVDTQNYPVTDREIVQKIGLIDFARTFQQYGGLPENLGQKSMDLNNVWLAYKYVEFEDETIKIIGNWFSTAPGLGWIMDKVTSKIKQEIWDPISELRSKANEDIQTALNNYNFALKIASNEIVDYQVAHEYLEAIWKGEVYQNVGTSLLYKIDEVGKSKLERIRDYFVREAWTELLDLIFKGAAESVISFIEMDLEAVDGAKWEDEYTQEKAQRTDDVEFKLLYQLWEASGYTLELAKIPRIDFEVHSPVEIRIYDSQGWVTGIVNGEERIEIPYSVYRENAITIFLPNDSYRLEISGTGEGSYDVSATRVAGHEVDKFTADNIPVSVKATHQLAVDWDTFSKDTDMLPIQVDSDGDGVFEEDKTVYLSSEVTSARGLPSWLWLAIGIVTGFAIAYLVWLGKVRKQGTKAWVKVSFLPSLKSAADKMTKLVNRNSG